MTASTNKIPIFTFDLSLHNRTHAVLVNKVVFHTIDCDFEFYRALGYPKAVNEIGMVPDEFIWEVYRRNGAARTDACLQAKIQGYLYRYSARFRNEYGGEYARLAGKCQSDRLDDSEVCSSCPMRPPFSPKAAASAGAAMCRTFDDAKAAHLAWKRQLLESMEGVDKARPDSVTVEKDDLCEFGNWLNGVASKYMAVASYQDLVVKHARFHRCASEMVHTVENGGELYSKDGGEWPCEAASREIVSTIATLRNDTALRRS